MNTRLAVLKDIDQLIKMRWDFTMEDNDYAQRIKEEDYESFKKECHQFLNAAIQSDNWFIWIVEINDKIV
ncbi:hypothetical protein [Salinicoccus sp. YB14-2]|uniref:hypothetical protein n=1 Tax=Salinicoccus sp. YB14-2 TaxID=1572701 RepID=UPI000AB1F508|nr:hypothetical protein [Salinicoccus sp. YB14-2]